MKIYTPDQGVRASQRQYQRPVRGNVVLSDTVDIESLASQARENPKHFAAKVRDLTDSGELRMQNIASIKRLYDALKGVKVDCLDRERGVVSASAFPLLAGNLAVAGVNDAFEAVGSVRQFLVREEDNMKEVSQHALIVSHDAKKADPTRHDPDTDGDWPLIGAGEEKFEIRSRLNGRMLKIRRKMVEENDVAGIVGRINALGEIMAELVEEITLKKVTDHDGSAAAGSEHVLRPNGTGTALYTTSTTAHSRAPSGTRINNNALADLTDLQNARAVLNAMTNTRGKRMNIGPRILFVPDTVLPTALKLLDSELTPGTENELNPFGPRGALRVAGVVSTPKLDDLSTSAWYMGNFRRQFVGKWRRRAMEMALGEQAEAALQADVVFQASMSWDYEVGAVDHAFVVQSLTATTAPKDE